MKNVSSAFAALFLLPLFALDVIAATPQVLNPPAGFAVAQDGLREVNLSWTAPDDGTATRYVIERADRAEGPFEVIGEAQPRKASYSDRGLPGQPLGDGKAYFYRLYATAGKGLRSTPSETLKSVTAPSPEPPSGIKAVAAMSRGIKLAWQVSASGGVVKYRVERTEASQPDGFVALGDVVTTDFTDGGSAASTLKDSTRYLYRVTAINRVDATGRPSDAVEVTTLPPPEPPRELTAGSGEVRCVPLAWQPSPENDVVRYDVYRANAKKGPFEKIGAVPDRARAHFLDGKTDPGDLEDDGTYYYRVRAVNAVTAESADSEVVSATTREVPPRIGDVRAQVRQPREVPLAWQQSPDAKVLGYEIWRAEGEGDFASVGRVGGIHTTQFVDRGGVKQFPDIGLLKDDTVYSYKIIAFNTAYARSSASAPVSSQTKPSPATPQQAEVTTNLPRSTMIGWAANTETDIVAYAIESSSDGTNFRPLTTVPAMMNGSFVFGRESDLEDGVVRYYRVRAIDKDRLVSPWSAVVAGRAKPLPDAPSGLKQEPTPAGVHITWSAPPQPDIKAYKLYTKSLLSSEAYALCEAPDFTVEWPSLKGQLKLVVTAIDADNLESARSEQIVVNPRSTP